MQAFIFLLLQILIDQETQVRIDEAKQFCNSDDISQEYQNRLLFKEKQHRLLSEFVVSTIYAQKLLSIILQIHQIDEIVKIFGILFKSRNQDSSVQITLTQQLYDFICNEDQNILGKQFFEQITKILTGNIFTEKFYIMISFIYIDFLQEEQQLKLAQSLSTDSQSLMYKERLPYINKAITIISQLTQSPADKLLATQRFNIQLYQKHKQELNKQDLQIVKEIAYKIFQIYFQIDNYELAYQYIQIVNQIQPEQETLQLQSLMLLKQLKIQEAKDFISFNQNDVFKQLVYSNKIDNINNYQEIINKYNIKDTFISIQLLKLSQCYSQIYFDDIQQKIGVNFDEIEKIFTQLNINILISRKNRIVYFTQGIIDNGFDLEIQSIMKKQTFKDFVQKVIEIEQYVDMQ